MNDDFYARLERKRIRQEQTRTEARAKKARYNAMSPADLAQDLMDRCRIEDPESLEALEKRLMRQALTLDSSFFTAMHDAGLGHKTDLHLDTFKIALNAQKLCRQTYDTLKSSTVAAPQKTGKQTIGTQNNET